MEEFKKEGINPALKHMSCSAATVCAPLDGFTAARLGLSLYGLHPAPKTAGIIKLKPVLSWKTKIIQVKTVPKNTKIGYGGSYTTTEETRIAVLPVGYYDGYDRKLSNAGSVLVQGQICPVRGRICMNLMMVDITRVKTAKVGDEVVLIGKQGKNTITAEDMATLVGTINYEVVSRINPLLPRVVI